MKVRALKMFLGMYILFITASCSLAETASIEISKQLDKMKSMCYVSNELYLLGEAHIYQLAGSDTEPQKMIALSNETRVDFLFIDNEIPYGLNAENGQVYAIEDERLVLKFTIPLGGSMASYNPERIVQVIAIQGYIVMLKETSDRVEKNALLVFNKENGLLNQYEVGSVHNIVPYRSRQVILISCDESAGIDSFRMFDFESGRTDAPFYTIENSHPFGASYSPTDDAIYYCANNNIQKMDAYGAVKSIGYMPIDSITPLAPFALSENGDYSLLLDNTIFRYNVFSEPAENKELTICGYIDETVKIGYAKENPNVIINMLDAYENADADFVIDSLITGRDDFDIFVINTAKGYSSLVAKGYYENIAGNEALISRGKLLYPQIQELIFADGNLIAYPAKINLGNWSVNIDLWEDMVGGNLPETFEGLFSTMENWFLNPNRSIDYTIIDICIPPARFIGDMIRQYILDYETGNQPVNFDTDVFRALLEMVKRYNSRDAFKQVDWQMEMDNDAIIYTYDIAFGVTSADGMKIPMMPPPKLFEGAPNHFYATMDLFVVNPMSKNKEAAIDFISYHALKGDKETQYALSPALNEPVRNDNDAAYIANLEKEIALFEAEYSKTEDDGLRLKIDVLTGQLQYAQENLWDISKEGIEKYREVAQNMHFPYQSLLLGGRNPSGYDAMYEKSVLYTSGQIDEEQLIEQLNEIARRVYLEAQ